MNETPRRRMTVTSSSNKVSTDQLGNRVVVLRGYRFLRGSLFTLLFFANFSSAFRHLSKLKRIFVDTKRLVFV
jgi:hypothetical protein